MIVLRAEDDVLQSTWDAVIELARCQPMGWTLIGAQMVALHAFERDRVPPRRSMDADVLVNVRVLQDGTRRVADTLSSVGFAFDGSDPFGVGHRFRRGAAVIDVLGPDGLGERTKLTTVPPAHTVRVPGGSQALERTERIQVQLGNTTGVIPRPNLLGAILIKARAVGIDDSPDAQRQDFAFLCSLVTDPRALVADLKGSERKWLRQRQELLDRRAGAWTRLGDYGDDAHRAFRLLAQS